MSDPGPYMAQPDPDNPGRWRVRNTRTKVWIGPSYQSIPAAQREAQRRNENREKGK